MTRYKAIISYDGHDFAGFQRQPHARSVQEEIEKTGTQRAIFVGRAPKVCQQAPGDRLPSTDPKEGAHG